MIGLLLREVTVLDRLCVRLNMHLVCPEYRREKSSSNKLSDSEEVRETPLDLRSAGLAGVLKTVKSLATNGPYVFTLLYGTCHAIIINGFIAFGAKYFQQQFGLTATMAGILFG